MLNLTRWNPFDELALLHRDLDRMFARSWSDTPGHETRGNGHALLPASEMTSDGEAWYVRVALPGIDPKDVQIEVTGNVLSVAGERRQETKDEQASLSEISYGRFERRYTIPEQVDVDQVRASYRHGILELTLPVKEAAKPRRIALTADSKKIAAA